MKNNKKMQSKYKKRRIAFVLIVILLIILLLSLLQRNNIIKIASGENALNIGGESLDISQVISLEENAPVVGAGMIPIKWNDDVELWEITTTSDPDWYKYANGRWANVMLSDGYYKSEPQPGINPDEQLAERNPGTQIQPDQLGTIFTWIPRLAYSDDRIEFLKGINILEYMWTTESCFNLERYGINRDDIGFTGIWIGQEEFESATELQNKTSEMSSEENIHGLIANETITSLTNSEKTAVQKLQEKCNVTQHETMLQDIENMQNRQVIKIINVNNKLPIMAKHEITEGNIIIREKYAPNGIKYVVDKEGNILVNNTAKTNSEDLTYTFYIIDNIGNIRRYTVNYGSGTPYLAYFNKNTTYYVTYDEEGKETSNVPIGETPPDNWYNYDNQQWANIVARDKGSEIYYTWIPRYMYTLDEENQKVNAKLVDLDNIYTDPETGKTEDLNNTEYKLPEAFTWEDPEDSNRVRQLTGYWMSKYKLSESSTYIPDISGGSGLIRVKNVRQTIGEDYTYEMYLIKDGKRVVKNEQTGELEENTDPMILTGNYTFTNMPIGEYAVHIVVKDTEGNKVKSIANQVTVVGKTQVNEPDISSFNKNLTYYVAYDEEGNENSETLIGETEPANWYNYDNSEWANIVVRENGMELYYVWIPRYQYKLDSANQKTNVVFIPKDKEPDEGYKIPEAFTWNGENISGYWMSKYKLSESSSTRLDATVTAGESNIRISDVNTTVTGAVLYEISLVKDGIPIETIEKQITQETEVANIEYNFTGLASGIYAISLIAKDVNGNTVAGFGEQAKLTKVEVDISSFNKNTTYYVTYNEQGVEDSSVPIGEEAPENWYDYSSQQWANIVVRDNGNEIYYTWIPRYQYIIDSANEKVKAEFIPKDKEADDGYKIPEAFTWNGENISGYWMSKYKLSESITYNPDITGGSGIIRINNVIENIGTEYTYEAYLIKDGKRIVKSGDEYVEGQTPVTITGNYIFRNVPVGDYTVNVMVKDTNGTHVTGISKQVTVVEGAVIEKPDTSNFNQNLTYYVTYDSMGNETSYIPVAQTAPENWYDYDNQQWANIVVRENGMESYYVWIPRYQYKLDEANQKTNVVFISKDEEADEGYKIPEAFTWNGENISGYWMSKYKLSAEGDSRLNATVTVGDNKIRISNIVSAETAVTYTAYLIKNGAIIEKETIVNEHTFDITQYGTGTYAVEIVHTNTLSGTIAGFAREITVYELDPPEVTGFNTDMTYIVTYDEAGNESCTQTLAEVLEDNAVINADNTLKSGKIDVTKIEGTWYDYSKQIWANIVVIDGANKLYFTWIPRYQYVTSSAQQKTYAELIPVTKTATEGYQIPEAFIWNGEHISGYWMSKYKLSE